MRVQSLSIFVLLFAMVGETAANAQNYSDIQAMVTMNGTVVVETQSDHMLRVQQLPPPKNIICLRTGMDLVYVMMWGGLGMFLGHKKPEDEKWIEHHYGVSSLASFVLAGYFAKELFDDWKLCFPQLVL